MTDETMALDMLGLVNEIMVEDVPLAEEIRAAVTALWRAGKRILDPAGACGTWHEIQRGEEELRQNLQRARRSGYVDEQRVDRAMARLNGRPARPLRLAPAA